MNEAQERQSESRSAGASVANSSGIAPDDSRIIRALQEYQAELRAGQKPSRSAFQARYPDIADALAECLDGLEYVHVVAPQLSDPGLALSAVRDINPEGPLGDFRIVREIGRGGMGVVYEAVQISLGRRVALKVLPFAAAMDPKQLQRFKNEAHAAALLHHTNIVPVISVGCERGVHYYAMQFIEGQPLSQVIHELRELAGRAAAGVSRSEDTSGRERQAAVTTPHLVGTTLPSTSGPPFFRTVAQLGVQAAEALEHAHDEGVVHRDIKPANLLVDAKGKLWITDFGLARCRDNTGLTMTGDVIGTLRYMSPEQALAKRVLIDRRTDTYSLGVTLYELLTLEPAFSGSDREELLRQIGFEEPPPPRQRDKAIPRELETIVLKAMEKSPEARYPTAQELADDLRRYLEDKPIRAKRPTLWQRAVKWARRHKTVVWAAVLLLMVAIMALGVSTFLIMQERDVAQANARRAEQILDTAYRSLERMYLAWAEKRLPQAKEITPEDRQFLEDALAFYMEFANQNSSVPAGRLKTAQAYLRVANIQAELGQDAQAKGNYRQALEAFRGLAAEYPDVPDYRCQLARCLTEMADFVLHKRVLDTMEESEEAFREAIQFLERLVAEHPTQADYQRDLVKCSARLGNDLYNWRRYDEAEQVCRPAHAIGARLVEDYPTVMTYQHDLCDVLGVLGNVFMDTGRLQEAERTFRERLDRSKQLAVDFPGRPYPLFCLSCGYQNLAQFQRRTQRLEEAAENLRQAVDVSAKLVAGFAGVRWYRFMLASENCQLAELWSELRRVQEAEQAYRDALPLWEVLARDDPTLWDCAVQLGRTQCNFGHLTRERGQPEAALAWYDQAIATFTEMRAKEPRARDALRVQWSLPDWDALLSNARGGRAVTLLGLRRLKEAEQAFKELEQSYQQAIELGPTNHRHWFCNAPLRLHLGDLEGYGRVCREMLTRFGHTDDPVIAEGTAKTCLLVPAAVADLGPVLRLADRAVTGTEQSFHYCWHLLVKGMAEYRAGHFANAIDRLHQALSLGREARYCNSRSLSGTACAFLAMAHHRLGRVAQARQALDQAKDLLEQPYSKIGWNWNLDLGWDNWLRFYLVYQEAEALVNAEDEP